MRRDHRSAFWAAIWRPALLLGALLNVAMACAGSNPLSVAALQTPRPSSAPVANAAFYPSSDAGPAPPFSAVIGVAQSEMRTDPVLESPVVLGRDARLFPGVRLEFFTEGDVLVPLQRGEMVRESSPGAVASYWRVIPQFGRVWHERADGAWSRAAFPIMLVNDTENHAHQGLATFLYSAGRVSALHFQFVQQTAPYLIKPHCTLWGAAPLTFTALEPKSLAPRRAAAAAELALRLPAKPLRDLRAELPAGTLDGFGGPLLPQWIVATALLRNGTLYYEASATPYGAYPYPLEMRFGVRSVMKSVGAPLALLRLAEAYGPYVLTLKIGDYVPGLDPKYRRIRFLDAAGMASGFGGTGSLKTHPNDMYDGYLGGDYDAWYTAPSNQEKIRAIAEHLSPYPWEPGTVVRYRDQDFYLLGVALDAFLKSVRGPNADLWDMLTHEVFEPIGIPRLPAVRTREAGDAPGVVWLSAGLYPTLDDLAKIAMLYQDRGAHSGRQILNRQLTEELLAARSALESTSDASIEAGAQRAGAARRYRLGFHFIPYAGSRTHEIRYLPTMEGSGENEVILFPGGMVSIRMAKAEGLPEGTRKNSDDGPATIRAVERLEPF